MTSSLHHCSPKLPTRVTKNKWGICWETSEECNLMQRQPGPLSEFIAQIRLMVGSGNDVGNADVMS